MIELTAISRKAKPWKDIEIAHRLTGKNESGRFKEIPNTKKLHIIDAMRTKKALVSICFSFC